MASTSTCTSRASAPPPTGSSAPRTRRPCSSTLGTCRPTVRPPPCRNEGKAREGRGGRRFWWWDGGSGQRALLPSDRRRLACARCHRRSHFAPRPRLARVHPRGGEAGFSGLAAVALTTGWGWGLPKAPRAGRGEAYHRCRPQTLTPPHPPHPPPPPRRLHGRVHADGAVRLHPEPGRGGWRD